MDMKKHQFIDQDRGDHSLGKETIGRTEYLSKLALRRDAMVQQEQMRLAQALSRLGIQSSLNKDHSFRLRMNGGDTHNSLSPLERTSMTTTVEKFRQMRQVQQKQNQQLLLATLLPLEGRQIFHKNLATSCDKSVQNKNTHRMAAEGSENSGNGHTLLSLSEGERTTHKEKKRPKKTTKELGNFSRDLLPQYYYIESKLSNMNKVRPKIKLAARHNANSLPAADNLGIVSSQPTLYYYPVLNHEDAQSNWQPGAIALESESPEANIYNSPQTRSFTRRRMKHRFDQPVDNSSFDNDMHETGMREQAVKREIENLKQMRSSVSLTSITEHPSLELVCSKCIALEKKQMSNRMAANSLTDFHEKRPKFLQTNNNSKDVNSSNLEDEIRRPPVECRQSAKKCLIKHNICNTEDESDEDNVDLMVTSLPAISQDASFSHHCGRGNVKRFYGSRRMRNGLKPHTILVDNVERPVEMSNLKIPDLCSETKRSTPRKINIVIDMPDTQVRSTTSDSDVTSDEEMEHPTVVTWADTNTAQLKSRHSISRK